MQNDDFQTQIQTDSHRYGNSKTIDEVFEVKQRPKPQELIGALAATPHLTEAEARAFVCDLEGGPQQWHDDFIGDFPRNADYESLAEFEELMRSARAKVAAAIWIYELIDAYRLPNRNNVVASHDKPSSGHDLTSS